MIGLIAWTRSFTYDKDGSIIKNADGAVFAAHPQPLYPFLKSMAKSLKSAGIKLVQLPPVTNGAGEGYSVFCLRDFNSNWGTSAQLADTCQSCEADGIQVDPDIAVRQMSGSNGPNVWDYTYIGYDGNTSGGWFAFYGQPGEAQPPMVPQDDVPNPSGNYAFGTVRANQHSDPPGEVIADTKGALKSLAAFLKLKNPRFDDGKGMWATATLEYLKTLLPAKCVVEYFSGTNSELYWFVHTLMEGICQVEDYPQYWPLQRMANGYDCTQFEPGYWSWDSANAVGFANNPDVATSWNWYEGGTISQQIAFNLLPANIIGMGLPFQRFMVYAEDYFPASASYPTGRGYKPYLDNGIWFCSMFAIGAFKIRWQDKDILAYTRNGDGGEFGWSGGCMIVVNLNTYVQRALTIYVGDMWAAKKWIHDYSLAGGATVRDFEINEDGTINITLLANAYSNGTSYALLAPGGVS